MRTITKRELVERIAANSPVNQQVVATIVQSFMDEITAELCSDNRMEFRDFGVFEPVVRKARVALNPKTLVKVPVPARRSARFVISRTVLKRMRATDLAAAQP